MMLATTTALTYGAGKDMRRDLHALKHGQQILYLFGELSRLANGAPACLLPTVTRV